MDKIINKYILRKLANSEPYPGYTPTEYSITSNHIPDMMQEYADHRESMPVTSKVEVTTKTIPIENKKPGDHIYNQSFETSFIISGKPYATVKWSANHIDPNSNKANKDFWTPYNSFETDTEDGSFYELFIKEKSKILNNLHINLKGNPGIGYSHNNKAVLRVENVRGSDTSNQTAELVVYPPNNRSLGERFTFEFGNMLTYLNKFRAKGVDHSLYDLIVLQGDFEPESYSEAQTKFKECVRKIKIIKDSNYNYVKSV